MSQSVPNIKINHQKHISNLYKWHKDHLRKSPSNPLLKISHVGISFFKEGVWGDFSKVILMSLIEVRNVFLMINFDVWDRLGHVWTIFDTVGLLGSIFHCHICEDFVSKWADLSVFKAFIRDLLIKALNTLKSAHFDIKSLQMWQWKIDPSDATVSKMVQTCPNRSQTSKLIVRNTFWTSISDIRITFKKCLQPHPLKKSLSGCKYDF